MLVGLKGLHQDLKSDNVGTLSSSISEAANVQMDHDSMDMY
jgi:hypothetical protein